MTQLVNQHCVDVNSGTAPATSTEIEDWLQSCSGWHVDEQHDEPRLVKIYRFANFNDAMAFSQRVAQLADEENHHPSILTEWGKVTLWWWTHAVKGLHKNDFIMAARSDKL